MQHVARELERQGFKLPLLIGGATTSKPHTAVKIAPHYGEPVVHVLDASRAVPVVSSLISADQKPAFVADVRADYERVRATHAGQQAKLVSLGKARAQGTEVRIGCDARIYQHAFRCRGIRPVAGREIECLSLRAIDFGPEYHPGDACPAIAKGIWRRDFCARPDFVEFPGGEESA